MLQTGRHQHSFYFLQQLSTNTWHHHNMSQHKFISPNNTTTWHIGLFITFPWLRPSPPLVTH